MSVEIKFDSSQPFQEEAIASVIDLFVGANEGSVAVIDDTLDSSLFEQLLFSNKLDINREQLITNLDKVQRRKRVKTNGEISEVIPSELVAKVEPEEWPIDFSIEMETGTGKTYVYIRTAIELYLKYGMSKFVIVVPTIAIREGVISTLDLTREHFKEIYSGIQYDSYVYDSKNVNRLRQFASSSHLQFLIINIAAFNKDENIIHKKVDSLGGKAPIDFIKAVRPVVIMDEPQKLSSELAKESIKELNPLLRLRYSATHKELHHLVYRLSPLDAYELRLVKRIDVLSMKADLNLNVPYVELRKITSTSGSVTATLGLSKNGAIKQFTASRNSDLEIIAGSKIYEGWVVEDICAQTEYEPAKIQFSNGRILRVGSSTGIDSDLRQRAQIRSTIQDHFDTELLLKQKADLGEIHPTKPLTLFFIDRVANYAEKESKFRVWFEEEYESVSKIRKYRNLEMPQAVDAHSGYFASTKQGLKDSKEGKGNKEDEEAYDLIMRSKQKLLSFDVPVRFIFSHSALSEGWDNPNVFTICNLQETQSDVRRRQQIGRGLRLPVMANGERCRVEEVNHLTIVATETFEEFAASLQKELRDENGIEFEGIVRNKRERVDLIPKDDFWNIPGFEDLWKRISPRTHYRLNFDTAVFIDEAVRRLKNCEPISELKFNVSKHAIGEISKEQGIVQGSVSVKSAKSLNIQISFPDILGDLSSITPLSRSTISRVIQESGRLQEARKNPIQFVDQVKTSLFGALAATLKDHDGIEYKPMPGNGDDAKWSMEFFKSRVSKAYESSLEKVTKSIYDYIPVDSEIEREFARGLEAREDVELFIKLPGWFKIDTPVGGYNPDWAIVRTNEENEKSVYLVRETKGTTNLDELFRESEVWKVVFGGEHFKAIGIDYKMVKQASDLDKDEYLVLPGPEWHGSLKSDTNQ
ncbi:COG3587 Restriction endonuclease [Candidatus Nanopelagicaceae bacterium]